MATSSTVHITSKEFEGKDTLPGAWLVLSLLFLVGVLNYLDRSTITTMHKSITTHFEITDAQFGLLTAVFLWTYGLLSPFAGFLADRFSRTRVIIASLIVWSLVTYLTGYSKTFEQLLITRALMGISEACYIPAALALLMDYHRGSTRSIATGINIVGMMVGSGLGFIGGWIAENHHWSTAFHVFGAIGVAYSLILLFVLRDAPKEVSNISQKTKDKVNFSDALSNLFNNRSFILLLLFWGLLGAIGWVLVGWLPTFYQTRFNLSQSMAGLYATGYFYPAAMIGLLIGGFWADRWSKGNSRARILVPMIGLCIAAPCIFIASSTNLLSLAVIFFLVFALTRMFSDANLMPILSSIGDNRYLATGYGIMNFLATIIGGIGIYVGGVLRDRQINLGATFKITSIALVLCAILLYFVKPKLDFKEKENSEN